MRKQEPHSEDVVDDGFTIVKTCVPRGGGKTMAECTVRSRYDVTAVRAKRPRADFTMRDPRQRPSQATC